MSRSTQGLLTLSNIQHGVRIEAVFASLQQGEHTDQIQQFSCIHPVIQTRNKILQTELFPKKRREKISKERYFNLQQLHSARVTAQFMFSHTIQSSRGKENYSTYRINSFTRILQEILQLQGSFHADRYKASSSNCSLCIQAFYMAEQGSKASTVHPGLQ